MIAAGASRNIKSNDQTLHLRAGEWVFIACTIIALIWSFYYGLVIKFTLGNSTLFALKTYVPEALLVIALLAGAFNGLIRGVSKTGLVLLCLLCIVFCLGIAFDNTANAALVIRDVYIPVFFLLLMCSARLSKSAAHSFMSALTFTMGLYVIIALVMYFIEATNGFDWTARFYTGYTFWGTDPVSKIAINSGGGAMRLPGPTGTSVKCALYALAAMCVFLSNESMKGWKKLFLIVLCFACFLLYNNRSSLFGAVAILLYFGVRKLSRGKASRFLNSILAVGIVIIGVAALAGSAGSLNFSSLYERFALWHEMFSDQMLLNLFLPTNAFSASAGGEGIAGASLSTVWDNSYLYFSYAFGLFALLLLIGILCSYWARAKVAESFAKTSQASSLCRYLLLATLVVALVTNIFQGRSWFFVFVVIFGSVYASINGTADSFRADVVDSVKHMR